MSSKVSLIVVLVVGVAIVALLVFSRAGRPAKPEASAPTDKPTGRGGPGGRGFPDLSTLMRKQPPPAEQLERMVPKARITVDGDARDWADVPVFLKINRRRRDRTNYGCRSVKLARDDKNLYLLFTLSLGVGERYERQMRGPRSRPSSGALGHFRFRTEGGKFVIWLPTGFSQTYDRRGKLLSSFPTAHRPSLFAKHL